ncbi:MAG: hypothetical protein LBQ77_06510 [Treponema sp.]|jgi:hypothetical protein|nr:hypothetical protein [Treponema sp.]
MTAVYAEEMADLLGLTINELFEQYGAPQTVYAVRGNKVGQDDVVFRYPMGDFYLYRDQVWQVALKSAYDVNIGDNRETVQSVLGERSRQIGRSILLFLSGQAWPRVLRVDFDDSDVVSAIFIYRPDF